MLEKGCTRLAGSTFADRPGAADMENRVNRRPSLGERITDSAEWIEHKGRRIIYLDFRPFRGDELVQEIRKVGDAVARIGENGEPEQLRLIDVRGILASQRIMGAFKAAAAKMQPYRKATAAVGVERVQKYLVRAVQRFASIEIQICDTVEEAKDWLVEQADK